MLLINRRNHRMVQVDDVKELVDLFSNKVHGSYQEGEEPQEAEVFVKKDLVFLSGESLPRCWTDPHYRDNVVNLR